MDTLEDALTENVLLAETGETVFARGVAYYESGAVSRLDADTYRVTAIVRGTRRYQVAIETDAGELIFECSCPYEAVCKHCVAAGLAWLHRAKNPDPDEEPRPDTGQHRGKPDSNLALRAFLEAQPVSVLVEWLLAEAQERPPMLQRLRLRHALTLPGDEAFRELRQSITQTTRIHEYIWEDADEIATEMLEILHSLDTFPPDKAGQALLLTEYALSRLEKVIEQVDDSENVLGDIMDDYCQHHQRYAQEARPEPATFAARLFRLTMNSAYGFQNPVEDYAEVLGESGLAHFQTLVEEAWRLDRQQRLKRRAEIVPPIWSGRGRTPRWVAALQEADKRFPAQVAKTLHSMGSPENDIEDSNYQLDSLMTALARRRRDLDTLILLKSRHLSGISGYHNLVTLCDEFHRPDLALEWAEKGQAALPLHNNTEFTGYLADRYLADHREHEALTLSRELFNRHQTLAPYKLLFRIATALNCWKIERTLAQALLDGPEAGSPRKPAWQKNRETHVLEIALWENDIQRIRSVAVFRHDDVELPLLMRCAAALEADFPDDAIRLYRKSVRELVSQTNNHAYQEAITYVKEIRRILLTQKQPSRFSDYTAELSVTFKAKRNFMKLLADLTHTRD